MVILRVIKVKQVILLLNLGMIVRNEAPKNKITAEPSLLRTVEYTVAVWNETESTFFPRQGTI